MFNYTFKIVYIYIVGCKSPQNALLAVINSKSITKEVTTILRKSINEPQYSKLISKKYGLKFVISKI